MGTETAILVQPLDRLAQQIAPYEPLRLVGKKTHDDFAQHHAVRQLSRVLPGFAFGLIHPGILPSVDRESIA